MKVPGEGGNWRSKRRATGNRREKNASKMADFWHEIETSGLSRPFRSRGTDVAVSPGGTIWSRKQSQGGFRCPTTTKAIADHRRMDARETIRDASRAKAIPSAVDRRRADGSGKIRDASSATRRAVAPRRKSRIESNSRHTTSHTCDF